MRKLVRFIKKLFKKKEEEVEYPREFIIIDYSESAKKNGIFEDYLKEIRVFTNYSGIPQSHSVHPYNENLILAFEGQGIPSYDKTRSKFRLPITKIINPQVVRYESAE